MEEFSPDESGMEDPDGWVRPCHQATDACQGTALFPNLHRTTLNHLNAHRRLILGTTAVWRDGAHGVMALTPGPRRRSRRATSE